MKLFFSLLVAGSLGTAASAMVFSDREADLRLNTAAQTTSVTPTPKRQTLSTRNTAKRVPYAYTQPYGVGPDNDSR